LPPVKLWSVCSFGPAAYAQDGNARVKTRTASHGRNFKELPRLNSQSRVNGKSPWCEIESRPTHARKQRRKPQGGRTMRSAERGQLPYPDGVRVKPLALVGVRSAWHHLGPMSVIA